MRKFYSLLFLLFISVSAFAAIDNGFYRVNNYKTGRYIYVYDNTGSINVSTTSADMGAIQLWSGFERTVSDPASVIYIKKVGDYYDLLSQGTGVHQIIGYYVDIYDSDGCYKVYAKGKYLSDGERSSSPDGELVTNGSGDYRKWKVSPINQSDNYFGFEPELNVDGKYWQPFYADFAFSFADSDMKAYYISAVYDDAAIISEIKSDIIPDRTPVFISCKSNKAIDNKLSLYKSKGTKINDNKLKGVYFNNPYRKSSKDARTAYNASTMRVLGVTLDGKLGYIKADIDYLPANESYLTVPSTAADELPVMTLAEYEEYKFQNQEFTITFETDGGSYIAPVTQKYATAIVAPEDPVKTGYTFIGWNPELPSTMPAENLTVTAMWQVNQYTISFDSDGGTEVAALTQDYATAIVAPEDPVKTGYTFIGWEPELPSTMPAENLTVTARWRINSYQLTYMIDGQVYKTDSVEFGAELTSVYATEPAPDKTGYTFTGWTGFPLTMPANDVIVYAEYTINYYNVEFVVDGQIIQSELLPFESEITLPAEPSKEGYIFAGWSPEVDATVPDHDVTYTAQWTEVSSVLPVSDYEAKDVYYNLNGIGIVEPQKGIFIFNGKKYMK